VFNHFRSTVTSVAFLVVGGIMEAISVLALFPLVASFLQSAHRESVQPIVAQPVLFFGQSMSLLQLAAIVLFGVLLKGLFFYVSLRRIGEIVAELATSIRMNVLERLFYARQQVFVNTSSGVFQSNLGIDSLHAAEAYESLCEFFSRTLQTFIYLCIVFFVSPNIGVFSLVIGFFVFVFSRKYFSIARSSGRLRVSRMHDFTTKLSDTLHALKVIKAMSREKEFLGAIETDAQEVKGALLQHTRSSAGLSSIQEPILVLGILVCLFYATEYGKLEPAEIAVLGFVFLRIAVQLRLALFAFQQLSNKVSAFSSIENSVKYLEEHKEHSFGRKKLESPMEFKFNRVSFVYASNYVVDSASFTIAPGKLTVLIGSSGSGKTTILDLCAGLLIPTNGELFVNNILIEELDMQHWRKRLGYVQQSPSLVHGSILENITLGENGLSLHDVENALRLSAAEKFVASLPEGLMSDVGEHGNRLSTGQRQRIGFARAIAHNPDVLLLDEITGNLDSNASKLLIDAIVELKSSKTIVAATHQQDLVANADSHYLVERGKVSLLSREQALERTALI